MFCVVESLRKQFRMGMQRFGVRYSSEVWCLREREDWGQIEKNIVQYVKEFEFYFCR